MTRCHSSVELVIRGGVKLADGGVVGEMNEKLRCVYDLPVETDLILCFSRDSTRPSARYLLEVLLAGHFHVKVYTFYPVVRLRHSLFKTPLLE